MKSRMKQEFQGDVKHSKEQNQTWEGASKDGERERGEEWRQLVRRRRSWKRKKQ